MILLYNISYALATRMWCAWCMRLRPMDAIDQRIWGGWRCRLCGHERQLRLLTMSAREVPIDAASKR